MGTTNYLFAGFGGQGILFSGKVLAYKGLTDGKNVSWLPSYGPEMRGGTANCSVIISDEPIGSPIVSNPDVLIAMNLPSLDAYENSVKSGGKIFVDSTLVERKVNRTDVEVYYVPCTALASEHKIPKLANMIIMGKVLEKTGGFEDENGVYNALKKVVSAKHEDMLQVNLNALKLGKDY